MNKLLSHRAPGLMVAGALFLIPSAPSVAHHGWGSYDADNPITIEGVITHVQYQNPHVHVMVPGTGQSWELVLAPISRMELRGAMRELVKNGSAIKAYGYKSRANPNEMRAERITIDGKTIEMR